MANGYVQHIRYQKTHIFSFTLTEVVIHYDTIEVVLIGSQNQQVELLLETELLIIGLITANAPHLCLVADYEATQYQFSNNLNTRKYVRINTKPAIKYSCCYAAFY